MPWAPSPSESPLVSVVCAHRDDAFQACRWLIDALKDQAPSEAECWPTARRGPWTNTPPFHGGCVMRTATSMLCWLSLSLWLAAALTAGGAAFGVFATMPELQISLANYGHLPSEDQARLAAGLLTEPIFAATDILQILFSTLLLLGVVAYWWLGMGRQRPLPRLLWTIDRVACGMLWCASS